MKKAKLGAVGLLPPMGWRSGAAVQTLSNLSLGLLHDLQIYIKDAPKMEITEKRQSMV